MNPSIPLIAAAVLAVAGSVRAQALPAPENVLQLSSSATVEVVPDLLRMQLVAMRQGPEAAQVQEQLKSALEQALAEARRAASPGQMDVRTGDFRLTPQYAREGRISGWQGTAELVLEGRDFARIAQSAGRIQGLSLGGVGFMLSREQRAQVERDAQGQAIAGFRTKAGELAKGFGFTAFTLREVTVHAGDVGAPPRPMRMGTAEAAVASVAPVPVEPGKTAVTVTVSGSVQLR